MDTVEIARKVAAYKLQKVAEHNLCIRDWEHRRVLSASGMTNYNSTLTSTKNPEDPEDTMGRFWRRFELFTSSDKTLFATTHGYLGFTSAVKVGDEIIAPLGVSAHFVVRFTNFDFFTLYLKACADKGEEENL